MREYIDVVPSNGSGTASYKDGNPIVNFIIGAQDRFLLGSTIRLNGKFTAYNSADDTGAALKVATPTLAMEPRLGVFSVIDSLAISSAQTSQTIEHIKHYRGTASTGSTAARCVSTACSAAGCRHVR